MHTHIIKIEYSECTGILANWIMDKLDEKSIPYYVDVNYGNELFIVYKGTQIFDIKKSYAKIKARLKDNMA